MNKNETHENKQQSKQPGEQYKMNDTPETILDEYRGSEKLKNKVALITGGDSGIGKSAAVQFAREGANVAIIYLEEQDADDTEQEHLKCLLIKGDVRKEGLCDLR